MTSSATLPCTWAQNQRGVPDSFEFLMQKKVFVPGWIYSRICHLSPSIQNNSGVKIGREQSLIFPLGHSRSRACDLKAFPKTFPTDRKEYPKINAQQNKLKTKRNVLAPTAWPAVTRKRLDYFQNAFFGKNPGAIGKQTNNTAKQTNTYLRLICCTCTKINGLF